MEVGKGLRVEGRGGGEGRTVGHEEVTKKAKRGAA